MDIIMNITQMFEKEIQNADVKNKDVLSEVFFNIFESVNREYSFFEFSNFSVEIKNEEEVLVKFQGLYSCDDPEESIVIYQIKKVDVEIILSFYDGNWLATEILYANRGL